MAIELLAIVETLKEFKGMLWGQDIKVCRCPRPHLCQSIPLVVAIGGICPQNNMHKRDS
jgi:hypothetical protein